MKEARMVAKVQDAVSRSGIQDEVRAGGLFEPRGHSGSAFAGDVIDALES